MRIFPNQWLRNTSTGKVCVILRVTAPWVFVRYQSGVEQRYHVDKIIKGFENCAQPALMSQRKVN